MTEKELRTLVQIAKKKLLCMEGRDDLEQHFSDEEDFLEVSIWELKKVLSKAYNFGKHHTIHKKHPLKLLRLL